jgi:predicted transposase YdaD
MTEKLIHRHDQFFKRLLDKPGTAGALLRERLPADVAACLTDDPPELVPGSFVPKELVEYRTDRLYRSRTRDGREVLIYTLIEHKSSPDRRIGVQLLGYVAQILQSWCSNNPESTPLPAILSLVIYNGSAHGQRPCLWRKRPTRKRFCVPGWRACDIIWSISGRLKMRNCRARKT